MEGILLLNDTQLQRSCLPFAADNGEIGPGRDSLTGLVAEVPGPIRLSHLRLPADESTIRAENLNSTPGGQVEEQD